MEPFGVSFFDIFLHAKKDIATGGRRFSREVGKKRATKDGVPEGRWISIAAIKTYNKKPWARGGSSEKIIKIKT